MAEAAAHLDPVRMRPLELHAALSGVLWGSRESQTAAIIYIFCSNGEVPCSSIFLDDCHAVPHAVTPLATMPLLAGYSAKVQIMSSALIIGGVKFAPFISE